MSAPGQETQPAPAPDQVADLHRARTIITDTNASPEVRRFGAEDLLRLDYPAAIDLAIEILRGDGDPLPRVAICEAIASLHARRTTSLSGRLAEPLLELLASADSVLRGKAAVALSAFRNGDVAVCLGEVAADENAPLVQRLAAVDALAPNVARRQVIEQLVGLLDSEDDELRARVMATLGPASRVDCGTDATRWRQWWETKRALDDTAWLLDRVDLLTGRNLALQASTDALRAEQAQREVLLSRRLADELQSHYRLVPGPQKDELLIRWLGDSLVDYRRVALSLIRTNISENNPPSTAARAAMRDLFADPSPELRREVFDVVAALTDPADADPVRARLAQEADPVVREAILRTLGRLQNPAAAADLTAELNEPGASENCVAEAAASLGMLASLGTVDAASIAAAVGPLKRRFAAAGRDDQALRAVLLQAMADIAATEFAEEFLANLDATAPDLLLPALAGVRAIGEAGRLDRILALVGHDDPRVRRRAIEAVAKLDGEPGHIETLFQRLGPNIEPDQNVRTAAWEGFRSILARAPTPARLQWADRLKDLSDLEEAYLVDLLRDLAREKPLPPECNEVRLRLAHLYDGRGRYADALPLWRDLHESLTEAGDLRAGDAAVALLSATLNTGRYAGLHELLGSLATGRDAPARQSLARAILDHLDSLQDADDEDAIATLLDNLDSLPPGTFDEGFNGAVRSARARLAAPPAQPTTVPAGS